MKRETKTNLLKAAGRALCAAALLAAYCTNPDFDNPFDSKADSYAPYTLTVNTSPSGEMYGSVWRSPEQEYYRPGAYVTVTATPAAEYRFTGWSGASSSTDPEVTVIMNGSQTLTANFEPLDKFSSDKSIREFVFTSPPATGLIDEEAKTISVEVPFGTQIGALDPFIVFTGASVNPSSGIAQDFSSPVKYTVTAEDGSSVDYNVIVTVAPPTVTAPNAPTGVEVNGTTTNSVSISWSTVPNAAGYRVYRSTTHDDSYYTLVASPTENSYMDTELQANTTYYYRVRAYNDEGDSENSITVRAATQSSGSSSFDPFNSDITYGTLTDTRDHKTYKTVTIGDQTWMAENLNYNPGGSTGSWCYGNSADSCAKYGRLYDWNTAMGEASSSFANPSGVQGVCPPDWHLPSHEEWTQLEDVVGGSSIAGTRLKSAVGWLEQGEYAPVGTNNYGFSALPGGNRLNDGNFNDVGHYGYWWSATENGATYARYRVMDYGLENVSSDMNVKTRGFSVRCVKN